MQVVEVVLAHAERAVVRVGDDVYVKVDVSHDRLEREEAALRGVTAVRVPDVRWSRSGVLAIGAVPGAPLARHGEPSPFGADTWRAVGAAVRRLHDATPPPGVSGWFSLDGLTGWTEAMRSWLLDDGRVDPDLVHARADHARRHLDGRTVALTTCHGDLQCEHVLVDDAGGIALIDWGDAGLADPAYDIAVLTTNDEERLDDLLDGYGASPATDREVIAAYWSLRRLGAVRWMAEHGYDPSGDVAALAMRPAGSG